MCVRLLAPGCLNMEKTLLQGIGKLVRKALDVFKELVFCLECFCYTEKPQHLHQLVYMEKNIYKSNPVRIWASKYYKDLIYG